MPAVIEFVDGEYFNHVTSTLSVSTVDGYTKLWGSYRDHFEGLTLDLPTYQCQGILRMIVQRNPHLTKTTVRHVKAFFSGIWSHAVRMGAATLGNPWRDVALPLAKEPTDTYAYSPEEIDTILSKLTGQTRLVVLVAACVGLRKSEIRGLTWKNWNAATNTLDIRQAVWRKHTKTTKSKASRAPVSVVATLATALNEYRATKPTPLSQDAFIFTNSAGNSLDLDNVSRREIVPALEGSGVQFHGWHAFRRGLATFLHAQGVQDIEIQRILRHENIAVTQASYVRAIPQNIRNAMATVNFGGGSK